MDLHIITGASRGLGAALASPEAIAAKLLAGMARDRRFTGETLKIDDYAG